MTVNLSIYGDGMRGMTIAKVDTSAPAEPIRRRIQDGVEGKYQFLRHIEKTEGIQIKPPCAVL